MEIENREIDTMVMGELEINTQVVVIGSGPGGYAAAFRAADLGLDVTMVDSSPRPGGACLHHGCIPAKTLLYLAELIHDAGRATPMGISFGKPEIDVPAVRKWQQQVIDNMAGGLTSLSRRRNIQTVTGTARFQDAHTLHVSQSDISRIVFEHAIVATGSLPAEISGIPFPPGGRIMDSGAALELPEIPAKLLVIGGGYVGLELATVYAMLGSQITMVERAGSLMAGVDPDLVAPLHARLTSVFSEIHVNTRVAALRSADHHVTAMLEGKGAPEGEQVYDRALVAVGRYPATANLGFEKLRVRVDDRGFVEVDDQQRTGEPSVFAVGDVTGGFMLAHKAAREGKVAAEAIAGRPSAFDARAIPAVVFTDPQIAWCGVSEEAARQQGRAVEVRRFPWKYSGRAATMGITEGLTKIVVDPQSGRIIGAGMVGRGAEGLISEAVLAIEMGALAEDVALSIHPHPTLSETEAEAAEMFTGTATHLFSRGADRTNDESIK